MKPGYPNSSYGDQYTQHAQQQQQPMSSIVLQTATRSLWVGNVDGSVTVDILTALFSSFGPIESVRLLLERECAFVNFYYVEDAIHAKDEVLGRLGGRIGNCMVRIGFGKADMAILPEPVVLQPTRALCKLVFLFCFFLLMKMKHFVFFGGGYLIIYAYIIYSIRARQHSWKYNTFKPTTTFFSLWCY